jgi:hypothetical protein
MFDLATTEQDLTAEAQALLVWLIRRGFPVTRWAVVLRGKPEERWRKARALDELLDRGYVYRDSVGWIRPASRVGR